MRSALLPPICAICALGLLLLGTIPTRADAPAAVDPAGASCDLALKRLGDDVTTAMALVHQISPSLVNGQATPTWQDFALLNNLIDKVQAGKQAAIDAGKAAELKSAIEEVERSIPGDPTLTALRDAAKGVKLSSDYQPGEYELKLEYQRLLSRLNHQLPKELRIPGVRLPHDPRIPALLAQAKALVANQEQRFQPYFAQTGFASVDDLRSALDSYDETAKNLAQALDSENVELAMNRPEGARWWVPRTGFQNQRISGTSRGRLDPGFRNQVEARMTGMDVNQYAATDNQFKPVYGYLKPLPQEGVHQSPQAAHYGDDVYIFKKDNVHDRLTWTAGDSFGPVNFAPTSPDGQAQNWRGFFIPWDDRLLIAPDVLDPMETAKTGFQAAVPQVPKGLDLPTPPTMPPAPARPVITPIVAPAPDLPSLPTPPPGPKLLIAPAAPPQPMPPTLAAPLMPPLQEGQSYDSALAAYQNSDAFKQYQAQLTQMNADYQAKLREYQTSDAMRQFQAKNVEVGQANQKLQQAYQGSDAYKAYQAQAALVQQERTRITQEFQQSDTWKAYQAQAATQSQEAQRLNAEYTATWAAYTGSPEYKAYQAAQQDYNTKLAALQQTDRFKWFNYNRAINPYFNYYGTSLAPFNGPMTYGYVELQYWGPLTLDDVETFEFRKTPPSGEFLKELQKRGIKIRDGRQDPAVAWSPGAD